MISTNHHVTDVPLPIAMHMFTSCPDCHTLYRISEPHCCTRGRHALLGLGLMALSAGLMVALIYMACRWIWG